MRSTHAQLRHVWSVARLAPRPRRTYRPVLSASGGNCVLSPPKVYGDCLMYGRAGTAWPAPANAYFWTRVYWSSGFSAHPGVR